MQHLRSLLRQHFPTDHSDWPVTLASPEQQLISTFRVSDAAAASIAAAASGAAILRQLVSQSVHKHAITVDYNAANKEFQCEGRFSHIDGRKVSVWDELVGAYKARDGWFRPHTNWPHHRAGFLKSIGLDDNAEPDLRSRAESEVERRSAHELAETMMQCGLPASSLRTLKEWSAHPQGQARDDTGPIHIARLHPRPPKPLSIGPGDQLLPRVRVLDLTRVIAGPTTGRTLAAYGADVIWITAEDLPSLPPLDAVSSRGKRTLQLDLRTSAGRATFEKLLKDADVLLQSYAPGALERLGYSTEELTRINPDLVYASVSAYSEGPWQDRRGFDSLVQFAVGINEAEGQAYSQVKGGEFKPRALPCQALDYSAGFLLAFGIEAALYRRHIEGGSYYVKTSLQACADWLISLGRIDAEDAFAQAAGTNADDDFDKVKVDMTETVKTLDGKTLKTVKHAAKVDGFDFSTRRAPSSYNDNNDQWL